MKYDLSSTKPSSLIARLLPAFFLAACCLQAAALKVDPEVIDLGVQRHEQTVTGKVTLTNTGTTTLDIIDVIADCSCTVAKPDKNRLETGESTVISTSMETRQYQGEVTRRIYVKTSVGDIAIPVRAVISAYPNWIITPLPFFLTPSLRGEKAEASITLTCLRTEQVQIKTISTSVPWLTGSVAEPTMTGKPSVFAVKIEKQPNAPAGYHAVKLTATTDDPDAPHLEISGYASVKSAVSVSPSPLVFPASKIGESVKMRGTLRGLIPQSDIKLEVTAGIVSRDSEFTANGECGFELTMKPETIGTTTQLLRIIQDGQIELEVPIILRGQH